MLNEVPQARVVNATQAFPCKIWLHRQTTPSIGCILSNVIVAYIDFIYWFKRFIFVYANAIVWMTILDVKNQKKKDFTCILTSWRSHGEIMIFWWILPLHTHPLPRVMPRSYLVGKIAWTKMAHYENPIAVIDIDCRLPRGASTSSKLWDMLCEGRDLWSKPPQSRFNLRAFHDNDPKASGTIEFCLIDSWPNSPPNKFKTNAIGDYFLHENLSAFDARFFNVTRKKTEVDTLPELCTASDVWLGDESST